MAETLVETAPKTADDVLSGTTEEFAKRIQNENGFYKVFEQKMAEGKVNIVDPSGKPAETPAADASAVEKTTEKPVEKVAKTPEKPEEEISVKIKKSDLGDYKSINDFFKSAQEKTKFVEHLKTQVQELNSKLTESGQTKAELDKLKQEKADLEKKMTAVTAQPAAPISATQVAQLADIKLPTFDDLDKLTPDQLQEKLYEADNLKKIIDGVRQTSKIVDYAKTLEAKINKIEEAQKKSSEDQAKFASAFEKTSHETMEKQRIDGIFNNIGELQNKFDDLKTKVPVREIDSIYTKFAQDLGLMEKKYDQDSIGGIVDKFFNDPSAEGDSLRQKAEALGIRPPEDVEKYLAIRKALEVSEQTKLPLEKAYILHQYDSGGINKVLTTVSAEEARKRQAAIDERKSFAKTAEVSVSGDAAPTENQEEKLFMDLLQKGVPFSEIKKNAEHKKLYDKFYLLHMGAPLDWGKY